MQENLYYQLDNYVTIRGKDIIKIKSIKPDGYQVETNKGFTFDCPLHVLKPLPILGDHLTKVGIIPDTTTSYQHHTKVVYSFLRGGHEHYLQGHFYADKQIWTYKGFTIYYFHQLQNLLRISAPGMELEIF